MSWGNGLRRTKTAEERTMKLVKGLVVFALGFGLGAALIPTLNDPPQLEPATTTATALVMRG